MKAKIQTKSNFKNLNGQWLNVKEIVGTRVTCMVFSDEFQKEIAVDFNLKEVVEMTTSSYLAEHKQTKELFDFTWTEGDTLVINNQEVDRNNYEIVEK